MPDEDLREIEWNAVQAIELLDDGSPEDAIAHIQQILNIVYGENK